MSRSPVEHSLGALLLATLITTGCDGGSSDDGPASTPQAVLQNTRVVSNGQVGEFVAAPAPAMSSSPLRPEAFSVPDVVLLDDAGEARIELAYRTSAALVEAFLTAEGEPGHVALPLVDETRPDDGDAGAPGGVIVELAREDDSEGLQCVRVRVRDETSLVSDDSTVCTVAAETDTRAERLIYLSSFDANSVLSTLSLDSGEVTRIGTAGVQLTDIAFLDDVLYGITFSELFRIDTGNARATRIGRLDVSFGANGLEAFDGALYAATLGGELVRVEPTTAETTSVATLPPGTASSGDLVHVEGTRTLLGTFTSGGAASDVLIEIDVDGGTARTIGEIGFSRVWGLGIARDQLLGLTSEGNYLLIDPATAESVLVERTEALRASGASLAP